MTVENKKRKNEDITCAKYKAFNYCCVCRNRTYRSHGTDVSNDSATT